MSFFADIDQLSRIMALVGKPGEEFLAKITSEDVSVYFVFFNPKFPAHVL